MSTIFGSGDIREIPIGVVDCEFSESSRKILRAIDATPTLRIAYHYTNSTEAINDIRAAKIFGYIEIPTATKNVGTSNLPSTIVYFYHYAYMGIGGVVSSTLKEVLLIQQLQSAIQGVEEMGVSRAAIEAVLSPLSVDILPPYNPSLNYRTYLSPSFFFILLQIVILMVTTYSVGLEFDNKGGCGWLDHVEGRMGVAILGKLLPYWLSFCGITVAAIALFFNWASIPFGGSVLRVVLFAALLVSASQGLSLLIYSLIPNVSLAMSGVSMIGSLGATLSGVTFPVAALYPIFQKCALLLPIRHFTILLQSEVLGGSSMLEQMPQIAVLLLFGLLPLPLSLRLKHLILRKRR